MVVVVYRAMSSWFVGKALAAKGPFGQGSELLKSSDRAPR